MENSVQLSSLLDSILQKAYGDLTNLTELLPRKTDVDRKLEIVQYARQTRQLLIRLLALVKWTKISDPVQRCAEVSTQIDHHSWVFVNTADELALLARNTLQQAGMPNFSLAPAVDVLTMGAYPRLPTCIRDRIIPPLPLTAEENQEVFRLLNSVIRFRLSHEVLPTNITITSINKGRVTLRVPYEFEVVLTVVGDDITLPWRLLELRILVGEALPGSPVLVTQHQSFYLHQMIQSRLCAEDGSLSDLFHLLHHFCLSLQLDCLHSQVERLSVAVCGIYIKIEEYFPGQQLKLGYWRSSALTEFMPAFLLNEIGTCPKLTMSVDPHSSSHPFVTTHEPSLPHGVSLSIHPHNLSLQELLVQCVRVRSLTLLKEFAEIFKGTSWEQYVELLQNPPCLSITLDTPLSTDVLLLSVDSRIGHIVASLEADKQSTNEVIKVLQQIEKEAVNNQNSLPNLLGILKCELYLTHVTALAREYKLSISRSLPLIAPLLLDSLLLFIELEKLTYLITQVKWVNQALQEKYYILRVMPCTSFLSSCREDIPSFFMKVISLIEFEADKVLSRLTGSLMVKRSSARLKRKLQEDPPFLPSVKRLCVCPSSALTGFPGLIGIKERVTRLQSSLTAAKLSTLCTTSDDLGTPHIEIFNMPDTKMGGSILSPLLCCYELWPHPDHVLCKLVFKSMFDIQATGPITIHNELPYEDIGSRILSDWNDKCSLLAQTKELHTFMKQGSTALAKRCSISSYTYEKLSLKYDEYQLYIYAKGKGVVVECPSPSPHHCLSYTLQNFLKSTKSLPLILQGLCLTKDVLTELTKAFNFFKDDIQLSGVNPSYIRLTKGLISLDIRLMCSGGVAFCGVTWEKGTLPHIVSQPTVLFILKTFLAIQLNGKLPDNLKEEPRPLPPLSKPSLGPSPLPISSAQLSSPLHSIPSLPPPTNQPIVGVVSTGPPVWDHKVSKSEWHALLQNDSENLSTLKRFLGSLSLLVHWVKEASSDRYLQQQMNYTSVDRGVFTYQADALNLSVGLDPTSMTSLNLSVKTTQDNIWSDMELQTLTDFFHKHVVKPPYSTQSVSAFLQFFWIPRRALKSCIQLMQLQMQPSSDTIWRVQICLTVPEGVELGDIARPGLMGIIFRGKLLLFLNLTRQSDQVQLILPILHDPKSNNNYVARRTNLPKVELPSALQVIDQTLRKPSQEWNIPPNESSLAYCIQYLLNVNLPV